jgi:hypothetical protein
MTTLFHHLESLTWSFPTDSESVYAISVYCEPRETERGVIYTARAAAESGVEGLACLDDSARAAVLALEAFERCEDRHAARLARRWLSYVRYMQLADGRFTNFVFDHGGRRNLAGRTSYPGGAWWTARALWALATAYRVLGDQRALAALCRCPLPTAEHPGELKTRAVLALAGVQLLRSGAPVGVRALWRRRVRRWCDAMVEAGADLPYVPDRPGERRVALWGYHQLEALAVAGEVLEEPAYVGAADRTVWGLVRPVIAGGMYYVYPTARDHLCAYCVAPLVRGLAALHRATGAPRYRTLALHAADWLAGANDAHAPLYDPETGRCLDGLHDGAPSRNVGAESAIEAGFVELERRSLVAAPRLQRSAELIS